MLTVYCIPGMGVNEQIFRNLKLEDCEVRYVKWITPKKNESLPEYADRLAEQIDTSRPFALIGMSFGGMCAVEIAKKHKPLKTILVSSNKTSSEIPFNIKMWGSFPIYKNLGDAFFKTSAINMKSFFGVRDKDQSERFVKMINSNPENYFAGVIDCLINWDNKEVPENLIHIHGTSDLVLPYSCVKKVNYTISEGSHFMIVNRADEINPIINKELRAARLVAVN